MHPRAVLESKHFVAAPCEDCDLAGHLVLRARAPGDRLGDIPEEGLRELGGVVAALENAVHAVIKSERLYVVRFSEKLARVHFHLFPRTTRLELDFLRDHRKSPDGLD